MLQPKIIAWGAAAVLSSAIALVPVLAQSRDSGDSLTMEKATSRPAAGRLQASLLIQQDNRRLKEMGIDEMFYSGERFRLKLRSDRDGYLYVLLRDSQGQTQLIYPAPDDLDTGDNRIARNQTQAVPARDYFRFDENPGTERVWVVVSPRPIADLDRIARNGGGLDTATMNGYITGSGVEGKGIDRAGDDTGGDRGDSVSRTAGTAVLPLRIVHLPR